MQPITDKLQEALHVVRLVDSRNAVAHKLLRVLSERRGIGREDNDLHRAQVRIRLQRRNYLEADRLVLLENVHEHERWRLILNEYKPRAQVGLANHLISLVFEQRR